MEFTKQITVNGVQGTLTIEEVHATRFGGHVEYKRATYRAKLAHGQYVDTTGNYTSKAQVVKYAAVDAEKFLAKVYKPAPVVAPVPVPVMTEGETDLLAILFGANTDVLEVR